MHKQSRAVTNKQLKPIQAKAYSTTFRGKPLEYQLLNKLQLVQLVITFNKLC